MKSLTSEPTANSVNKKIVHTRYHVSVILGSNWRFEGPICKGSASCFECMCGVESNENARGCSSEHGPDETCPHGACNHRNLSNRVGPCLCGSFQFRLDSRNLIPSFVQFCISNVLWSFRSSEAYYIDCTSGQDRFGNNYTVPFVPTGLPPDNFAQWIECAANEDCARQCVENYRDKYRCVIRTRAC